MTNAKSARINARLSPELSRKAAFLEKRLNRTTTQIVEEAIDRFYAAVTEEPTSTLALLERAGFVACSDGPAELSTSYKRDLATSLGKKA